MLSCTGTNVHTAEVCVNVLASFCPIVYPIPHHSSSRSWSSPRNSDTGGTSWLSWKAGRWTGTCNEIHECMIFLLTHYNSYNQAMALYSYNMFRLSYRFMFECWTPGKAKTYQLEGYHIRYLLQILQLDSPNCQVRKMHLKLKWMKQGQTSAVYIGWRSQWLLVASIAADVPLAFPTVQLYVTKMSVTLWSMVSTVW